MWSRRELLKWTWRAGLWAGAGGLAAAVLRFLSPPVETADPTLASAGLPDGVRAGEPVFVPRNRTWVVRDGEGLYALSAVCTHLGCTVVWQSGLLRCPCHGSAYEMSGAVVRGPAPHPLSTVWIGLNTAGQVVVDRGRTVPFAFRLNA
jgi:cytochrome b6-f complex iron-sulfur subunit